MAKTVTIGTKVEKATQEWLAKMAAAQGKSVAEFVRDIIEREIAGSAQGDRETVLSPVLERLEAIEQQIAFHHNALGELLMKAVKAGAG